MSHYKLYSSPFDFKNGKNNLFFVFRELMILEKLNHTNIVRLLMFHKTDKEMYFLFEQMFQTLYDKLDNDGPFEDEDTLWLSLQLFR